MNYTDGDSNLTNEEYYKVHGTLSNQRIEELLDLTAETDLFGARVSIQEAKASVFEEDAFSRALKDLYTVAKKLRGDNKEALKDAIDELEQVVTRCQYDAEEVLDQLNQALRALPKEQF